MTGKRVSHRWHRRCILDVGLCITFTQRVVSSTTGATVKPKDRDLVQHAALWAVSYEGVR